MLRDVWNNEYSNCLGSNAQFSIEWDGGSQAAAAHVCTGRVHQREVGVNVLLSVLHEYDQQRRTFREAVCEERAGAAAGAGASRQARGVILSTG